MSGLVIGRIRYFPMFFSKVQLSFIVAKILAAFHFSSRCAIEAAPDTFSKISRSLLRGDFSR